MEEQKVDAYFSIVHGCCPRHDEFPLSETQYALAHPMHDLRRINCSNWLSLPPVSSTRPLSAIVRSGMLHTCWYLPHHYRGLATDDDNDQTASKLDSRIAVEGSGKGFGAGSWEAGRLGVERAKASSSVRSFVRCEGRNVVRCCGRRGCGGRLLTGVICCSHVSTFN